MSTAGVTTEAAAPGTPTIWGLSPRQVHDRFWASRGVQVVRRGEPSEIVEAAELFLLIDPDSLVLFRLRDLVEMLSWLDPKLAIVRLRDEGERDYREVVESAEDGTFVRFRRVYEGVDRSLTRVGLTPSREVARTWRAAPTDAAGWRALRARIGPAGIQARRVGGRVFDARRPDQLVAHLEALVQAWGRPDSTVPRVVRGSPSAWADREATVASEASIVGKVWVGAGRRIQADDLVVGPAVLWDAPAAKPVPGAIAWRDLEPLPPPDGLAPPRRFARALRTGKRLFDVGFSLVALALTLPLYPFIALAILLEDGRPVFFAHRRETLGGREFPCLKFRTMRRDAERIKAELQARNVADGPQFFVKDDPRSTRVGRFLRKTQVDELPQFLNVLVGHMSVVGPRPSPHAENQFCPAWREARLSVRPGITGLWQIRRTREPGLDFQEWIRHDLDYVERMNWKLDLWILFKTVGAVLRRGKTR